VSFTKSTINYGYINKILIIEHDPRTLSFDIRPDEAGIPYRSEIVKNEPDYCAALGLPADIILSITHSHL